MSYRIVTDSASNVTSKAAEKYNIAIVPLTLIIEGEEHQLSASDNFDLEKYYEDLAKGASVSTSQVSPAQFMDVFEPILKEGEDILYIGISSGISGTINSAKFAAKELLEEYPERSVRVVDTLGAGLGEGLWAVKAAELKEEGKSLDEVADYLNDAVYEMVQVFIVDDLKHLRRTGRLSGTLASIGTMLDIKPILKGSTEGTIVVSCKARGRKQAIKALAEKYRDLVKNPEDQLIGISYGGKREDAVHLANLITKIAEPKGIWLVPHEATTGAHVGPGMIGLFFRGNDDARAF